MRLVVGYLATPSGADGVALGIRLARSLNARLELCMVIPPDRTLPARVPADPGYDDVLVHQAHQWLAEALATVPDDVQASAHLSFHESFAQGLLDEVNRLQAHAIVVGASHDGVLGRHAIGTVTSDLLHSAHVPVALAPRGTRHHDVPRVREVTCAVGTRAGAAVLLRTAVRSCLRMQSPLRLVSLVSIEPHHHLRGDGRAVRERAVTHAQAVLDEARVQLQGDGLAITAQVADGDSVESAVRTLEWHEGDIVLVGSSRLAQHHRLFLGSTAAKMLRVVPVPMVVVPNSDGHPDD
ncbi:universal stress protein [Rhodococcus daqingensis]|uniref:Universal stress protein n=1 Tax=Rhodococcus daqingensis TaxID=2479363 RepID=A0ABW2RRN2_9NOCA